MVPPPLHPWIVAWQLRCVFEILGWCRQWLFVEEIGQRPSTPLYLFSFYIYTYFCICICICCSIFHRNKWRVYEYSITKAYWDEHLLSAKELIEYHNEQETADEQLTMNYHDEHDSIRTTKYHDEHDSIRTMKYHDEHDSINLAALWALHSRLMRVWVINYHDEHDSIAFSRSTSSRDCASKPSSSAKKHHDEDETIIKPNYHDEHDSINLAALWALHNRVRGVRVKYNKGENRNKEGDITDVENCIYNSDTEDEKKGKRDKNDMRLESNKQQSPPSLGRRCYESLSLHGLGERCYEQTKSSSQPGLGGRGLGVEQRITNGKFVTLEMVESGTVEDMRIQDN